MSRCGLVDRVPRSGTRQSASSTVVVSVLSVRLPGEGQVIPSTCVRFKVITRSTRSIVIRSPSTTYMIRYWPTRNRRITPQRKESAGSGSPSRPSTATTTAVIPFVSAKNRDAVVMARGDHSILTGRRPAAACEPDHARPNPAVQPHTTPDTPPRPPRLRLPPTHPRMPAVPERAAAGTQRPERRQPLRHPDGSPHAIQCSTAQRVARSWANATRPRGRPTACSTRGGGPSGRIARLTGCWPNAPGAAAALDRARERAVIVPTSGTAPRPWVRSARPTRDPGLWAGRPRGTAAHRRRGWRGRSAAGTRR